MPPRRTASLPTRVFNTLFAALVAAVNRLDKSLDPRDTIAKLQRYKFTFSDSIYIFHAALAIFWVCLWPLVLPLKILVPLLFVLALLVPLTSQLLVPAIPVLSWVIAFFSSRFIPVEYRPSISVSLLPALESVLYGANISDILTRFTHPILDIFAWLPYGVLHFTLPFVVSIFLWLFRPKEALHFWARAFGYMNLIGVLAQIMLPCAAPWYELIYGLTPATYAVRGSAGGLMRIDALFGSQGYQKTFASSPVVFGAFPSLHAGNATIEALFWSHFFPHLRTVAWAYAGVLYWATMYLTHHYLVDVVGGACLATASFYLFLPSELRGANATRGPGSVSGRAQTKHELYDLEVPVRRSTRVFGHSRGLSGKLLRLDADADTDGDSDGASSGAEEQDIAFRSPKPDPETPVPQSAVPLVGPVPKAKRPTGHKHTASIASLTRGVGAEDDGWSPFGVRGFAVPSTPSRLEQGEAHTNSSQRGS
ncbi:PAP2-domain-containing protein [Sanghuangporus baumii]|uniref:PAP2-domain-containing protein n=1 Tax=Sanghuangporus baumii TaxID=108892 RepID=A0A9Q5N3U7_SANBA|nr:PAP2-domain-containing protein [Sanghuangporus baumii]